MNTQANTPNIVVDENFLMLEKKLRRRYAERAALYSDADTMEQERRSARAYSIAPSVFGESRVMGGVSNYQNGEANGRKYMTVDDYVSYFEMCHDTFGAMNLENVKAPAKAVVEEPRMYVNTKKIEQIKKINAKAAAKASKKRTAVKPMIEKTDVKAEVNRPVVIEESKLNAFFTKLASVRGRAIAGVAGVAVCFSLIIGSVFAFAEGPEAAPSPASNMERMSSAEIVSEVENDTDLKLLSTLE